MPVPWARPQHSSTQQRPGSVSMNSGGLYIYTPSKLSSVGPQGQGIVSIVSLILRLSPNGVWGQANPCDQNRCFRCRVPFGTPIVAVNARHYRLQAVYSCTRSAVPPCICAVSPVFGDEICRLEEVCAPPLLPDRFERHAVLLGKQLDGVPCGRKEHGQFVKG